MRKLSSFICLIIFSLFFVKPSFAGSEDAFLLDYFLNDGRGGGVGGQDTFILDYYLNNKSTNKNQSYPQDNGVSSWPIRAKFVGMSDATPIYISTEGLSRQKNGDVLFWMLRSWDEIKKIGDIPFLSNSTMMQLDCQNKTVKTVANMYWSGSYLRGKLVREDTTEGKKVSIAPNQVGKAILENLCK